MTVLTVFADASDGQIESADATYANAVAGTGTLTVTDTALNANVGQNLSSGSRIYQLFFSFDTSALGSTAIISAATLSLVLASDSSTTDFTCEARPYDFGAAIDTGDWRTASQLNALTLCATLATSTIGSTGSYKDFTENGTNLQAAINKTGTTRLVVDSDRNVSQTTPSGAEFVQFRMSEQTGTTNDPKLVVTYTVPTTYSKNVAGTVTPTGALSASHIVYLILTGGLTFVGEVVGLLAKSVRKLFAGTVSPAGSTVPGPNVTVKQPTYVSGVDGSSTVTGTDGHSTISGTTGTSSVSGSDGSSKVT